MHACSQASLAGSGVAGMGGKHGCCCCWRPTPRAAYPPLVAGGAEGRSGIAALLKIVTAGPSKGGKQQGGSGKGQAQAGAAEADDADSEEEEAEGGAERPGRGAGRRGGSVAAGRPARQRLRPLMRPIICICNDLYAPALRPLRDVARVFHFKKPQVGLVCAHCG